MKNHEISGRILDADGNPVAGTSIELHAWNGGLLSTRITDANGHFDFTAAVPGPYDLRVATKNGSQSLPLWGDNLQDMNLKLSGAPTPAPQTTSPTVSLNDLEASGKAKSKLAAAEKAAVKSKLAKAWELVNEAIQAAPNWGRAYLFRGVLSMDNHDYSSALRDLSVAVEHNPHSGVALTELGKLYSTTGNYELSAVYLSRALAIAPVLWPTYYEMAVLDLKRGNFAESEKMAEYAEFSTPPAPPAAHFIAGEAAYQQHDYKIAAIEFRSFLALAQPSPEVNPAINDARRRLASPQLASVH